MTLATDTVATLAARLRQAAGQTQATAPLSDTYPDLTEADAYAIQAELLRLTGGTRTGYKLGFTSAAMRQQIGVDHPNSGVLLDHMRIDGPDLPAGDGGVRRVLEPVALGEAVDEGPLEVGDVAGDALELRG